MIIGVMDSGIGGLGVLSRLIGKKCADRYLYFSDGANLPYGDKSAEEVRRIALEGTKRLADMGANAVIFGCNTLTVCALDYVRKRVALPLFGLLPRPELSSGKTLLLTTPATGSYLPPLGKNVLLLTPPRLASMIDREYPKTSETERYLTPLLAPYGDVDSVYLGCSHYTFAKEVIKKAIPHAKITEGSDALSHLVKAVLPPVTVKNQSVDFIFSGRNESARYADILSSLLS